MFHQVSVKKPSVLRFKRLSLFVMLLGLTASCSHIKTSSQSPKNVILLIADGLAAAEEGRREKAEAEESAAQTLDEAKDQAQEIIRRAERRDTEMVEEAKAVARTEGERLLVAARGEIDKEVNHAREELRQQVAKLAVAGASQILTREVDASAHSKMLDDLAKEL